ncbi:general substrate transporter [Mycena belliarum]|uniref:General substrate transporter n=1 Tax=Mycena belliarum TaxID=1033014 RepID=A0AAD6UCC5_9AGAR|nr:general substrate transporter [Mycena belliae]
MCRDMKAVRESDDPLNATRETETHRLRSTSSASFRLYLVLLVPAIGGACVGFDISDPGTCLAVLFAGPVSDRFGRRGGMVIHAQKISQNIVVTLARDVRYLKGGRFLLGISTALLETAAPMYVVEMSPPQWRGRLTGSGITTVFTGRLSSSAAWRVPFSIQIFLAAIVMLFSYLIPESPRWLVSVGRKDEAHRILSRYHGNGDANAPLVVLEWKEFEDSIRCDASKKPWWDYSGLFRTRSAWYRTFMLILIACCAQFSGSSLNYFLVVLLAGLGVNTQNLRFILSLVSNFVGATGGFCGAIVSDKVGRRTLWFWGNLCCTIALVISGACTAKWGDGGNSLNGSNTAIAFLFLFNFFFAATYLPLPAIYPSECMSFDNRANGVAFYTLCASMASFVGTYAVPIALERIQSYLVFIAWDVFACVLIWFFAVETSGKTLEELDLIFEVQDHRSVNASEQASRGRPNTVLNLVPVG